MGGEERSVASLTWGQGQTPVKLAAMVAKPCFHMGLACLIWGGGGHADCVSRNLVLLR